MGEFVVAVIGIVIAWKLFQGLLNAANPERARKIAERRYMENPTDRNYAAMVRASKRAP
jgi:hypothetical protein